MTMRDSRGYSVRMLQQIEAADNTLPAVRLAKLCVANNIPVAQVAKDLGTSKQSVYAWFTGHRKPSARFCERILALLDTHGVSATL